MSMHKPSNMDLMNALNNVQSTIEASEIIRMLGGKEVSAEVIGFVLSYISQSVKDCEVLNGNG